MTLRTNLCLSNRERAPCVFTEIDSDSEAGIDVFSLMAAMCATCPKHLRVSSQHEKSKQIISRSGLRDNFFSHFFPFHLISTNAHFYQQCNIRTYGLKVFFATDQQVAQTRSLPLVWICTKMEPATHFFFFGSKMFLTDNRLIALFLG